MYVVGVIFGFLMVGYVASHWPKFFLEVMAPVGIVAMFVVLYLGAKETNAILKEYYEKRKKENHV